MYSSVQASWAEVVALFGNRVKLEWNAARSSVYAPYKAFLEESRPLRQNEKPLQALVCKGFFFCALQKIHFLPAFLLKK